MGRLAHTSSARERSPRASRSRARAPRHRGVARDAAAPPRPPTAPVAPPRRRHRCRRPARAGGFAARTRDRARQPPAAPRARASDRARQRLHPRRARRALRVAAASPHSALRLGARRGLPAPEHLGLELLGTLMFGAGIGYATGLSPVVVCALAAAAIVNASPRRC